MVSHFFFQFRFCSKVNLKEKKMPFLVYVWMYNSGSPLVSVLNTKKNQKLVPIRISFHKPWSPYMAFTLIFLQEFYWTFFCLFCRHNGWRRWITVQVYWHKQVLQHLHTERQTKCKFCSGKQFLKWIDCQARGSHTRLVQLAKLNYEIWIETFMK